MSTLTVISLADNQEVACTGRETNAREGKLKLTFTCRGINDQQIAMLLEATRAFEHIESVSAEYLDRTHVIDVVIDISHLNRFQAKGFATRTVGNLLRCMQRTLTGDTAETGTNQRGDRGQAYVNDGHRRHKRTSRTGR